jgi:hypothetical protein
VDQSRACPAVLSAAVITKAEAYAKVDPLGPDVYAFGMEYIQSVIPDAAERRSGIHLVGLPPIPQGAFFTEKWISRIEMQDRLPQVQNEEGGRLHSHLHCRIQNSTLDNPIFFYFDTDSIHVIRTFLSIP